MRVIVTGGAGFIGSNLVPALLAQGHEVLVVDDLSTGSAGNVPAGVPLRKMDILDPELASVFLDFAPDAVVHLAAQASVPVSLREPDRDWAVNAEGTCLVASAAAGARAHRMISASSAAVYGEPAEVPLNENSRTHPVVPYGESKLAAESLLAGVLDHTATDYASFRFANVYGPRQDALGEGGVVAIFCHRLALGEPLVVYGTGRQTRDFVYVGDLVDAIGAALSFSGALARPEGSAYCISTGLETSVDDLARTLLDVSALSGAVEHAPARDGDVERSALDPARAREVFGWQASTPLPEGLGSTWRWFRESREAGAGR
jgi:UDP-glucose 4-epimerase